MTLSNSNQLVCLIKSKRDNPRYYHRDTDRKYRESCWFCFTPYCCHCCKTRHVQKAKQTVAEPCWKLIACLSVSLRASDSSPSPYIKATAANWTSCATKPIISETVNRGLIPSGGCPYNHENRELLQKSFHLVPNIDRHLSNRWRSARRKFNDKWIFRFKLPTCIEDRSHHKCNNETDQIQQPKRNYSKTI